MMKINPPEDLERLNAVCDAAGEWEWRWGLDDIDAIWTDGGPNDGGNVVCEPPPEGAEASFAKWPARAKFISTFNPKRVKELLAEMADLRGEDATAQELAASLGRANAAFKASTSRAQALEEENRRLREENVKLRARVPRAYVLTRAAEWSRLFREVHGYLKVCHGNHGTDFAGRQHAMKALDEARAQLEAALLPDHQAERSEGER